MLCSAGGKEPLLVHILHLIGPLSSDDIANDGPPWPIEIRLVAIDGQAVVLSSPLWKVWIAISIVVVENGGSQSPAHESDFVSTAHAIPCQLLGIGLAVLLALDLFVQLDSLWIVGF